jgi:alanine racemase
MHRSEITIDLGAVRRNVRVLLDALRGAQLWAVVKANAYGHGASDVAGAALGAGASALCVATVPEALALRRDFPAARIIVMGPAPDRTSSSSCRRTRSRHGSGCT